MVINGIDTKDISVVVQGAVGRYTPVCLASVREHLPGAEIVLSTWKGTHVENLDYDVLVLSDDPDGFDCHNGDFLKRSNIDRQIVSTCEGLKAAGKKYAVKLRTDFSLVSHDFVNWFGKYPKRSKASWLSEKLITCSIYARDPRDIRWKCPLHPSDFFFFGLRSDLLELFDIGLTSEEDRIWFARKHPDKFQYDLPRFVPEQFIWVGFLRKHVEQANALPEDMHDIRKETVSMTEQSIAGNLILLSPNQLGITGERDVFNEGCPESCYSHFDWYSLYAHYCGGNVIPYSLYRLKIGMTNMRTRFSSLLRRAGAFMVRHTKWLLKKFVRCLAWGAKRYIKPHIPEQRWIGWKLCFFDWKRSFWQWRHRKSERYSIRSGGPELSESELSVVVQGAVGGSTGDTIRSIRKILPNAEIVLSTWEGSNTDGLDYDILVKSEDPGPDGLIRRYPHKQIHNASREIVSTLAGVNAATRFFALKMRSDMQILSDGFIGYYNQFSRFMAESSYFERRIMVNGTTTVLGSLNVGDWWYLGARTDIQALFDIPLYTKEEPPYFEREENRAKRPFLNTIVCRYIPEVHIVYSFLRKVDKSIPPMENETNDAPYYVETQKKFIAENLICIEPLLSGIVLPKARNVENPGAYKYLLPLKKWYRLVRNEGMIERAKLPKEAVNTIERRYLKAPRWYDLEYWINIVKNYARIQTASFEADIDDLDKANMTFVVCGRIEHHGQWNTYRCLNSIRRFFSASRIILATWVGEDIKRLSGLYDEVVFCERSCLPKRDIFLQTSKEKKYNTINDQMCLASTAMQRVDTKYAVKFRTDFYLINDNILYFYKKWAALLDKREVGYEVFDARILVSQWHIANPRMNGGASSYMLSDCFQLGLTSDLRRLWSGELIPDEVMNWFEDHPNCNWENPDQYNHRYNAEQMFFMRVLKKALPNLPYPRWYFDHEKDAYTFESEKVLASNVLIGDQRLMGMYTKFDSLSPDGNLTFNRLLEIYLVPCKI